MSSDTLNKIVKDLSRLTVTEAVELSKLLEDKWGVEANAPVAAVASDSASGSPAEGAPNPESKDEFDIEQNMNEENNIDKIYISIIPPLYSIFD